MGTWRRTTGVVAVVMVMASLAMAPPASAASKKIGPMEYFTGVINGTDGNTTTPIPIQMACGGPAKKGHPVSGQTLAVHQLFPPQASGSVGNTGNDSQIDVFFNAPPPAAHVRGQVRTPFFTRYDTPKALSTKLTLPCSGTGTIYFSPVPVSPPSEGAAVPVQFESKGSA